MGEVYLLLSTVFISPAEPREVGLKALLLFSLAPLRALG